jgi:hypothetical protein
MSYSLHTASRRPFGTRHILRATAPSGASRIVATFLDTPAGREAADDALDLCRCADSPEDRRVAEKLADELADTDR